MEFKEATDFERETIGRLIAAGDFPAFHGVAVHRIKGTTTEGGGVDVIVSTNDDDDDGIPDGGWDTWPMRFDHPENFLGYAGVCRIGISGVIVTVTLDGKEIREASGEQK